MTMEKLSVPIAIVIAGALIGGALYLSNGKAPAKVVLDKTTTQNISSEMRPVSADDHILGNPNADVVIVEYSDPECPFCKTFNATMQQIMNLYGKDGRVAWVYRHFPIDQLHSRARNEAIAMECAGDQGGNGKFWEYEKALYGTTTSNNSLDPAELPKLAGSIGLDVTVFNTCLSSGKFAAKVEADYQDAIKVGGKGTPTSIILAKDGTKTPVEGAVSYEALKNIVDALLK